MLTTILVEVLYVIIMVALAFTAKQLVAYFKSQVAEIQDENLRQFIEDAIQYAEDKVSKEGSVKFNYVLEKTSEWCNAKNIEFNQVEVEQTIQSIFNALDIQGYVNKEK